MAESDAPVRCPRGHLTAAGYQFCTTCGERVAPEPDVSGPVGPPPLPTDADEDHGVGFALPPDLDATYLPDVPGGKKRGRLRTVIGRRPREPAAPDAIADAPSAPPALLPVEPQEPPIEPPKRGAGRLRRKKAPAEAAPVGPSLLTDADAPELEPVEDVPPSAPSTPATPSTPSSDYADVEFAIGPGTRSVVTYGRPEPGVASSETARKIRIPDGISTRVLVAILVVVAGIAAAIVLFVIRDPSAPAATLTAIPTVQPSAVQSSATPSAPAAAVVSEECANSFAFAAAHAAEAQAPGLQQRTLTFCGTSDEWLAAARLNPTAIGVTDAAEVGDDDLARICAGAPDAGLCSTLTPPPTATSTAVGSPLPSP